MKSLKNFKTWNSFWNLKTKIDNFAFESKAAIMLESNFMG